MTDTRIIDDGPYAPYTKEQYDAIMAYARANFARCATHVVYGPSLFAELALWHLDEMLGPKIDV